MDGHGWDGWDDDPPGHDDPYGDDPYGHLPGEDPLHAHLTGDGHAHLDDPAGDGDPDPATHPEDPLDDTHDLHDDDPYGDTHHPGPGDDPTPHDEPPPTGTDPAGPPDPDTVVGGDPDTVPYTDDPTWYDTGFPPPLALDDPPDPVDGYPWADPDHLGDPAGLDDPDDHSRWLSPSPGDLAAHDATTTTATWATLLTSPDPATSSLARWWAPSH